MANILVVEDDQDLQFLYRQALNAAGHRVEVAGDGIEALKMVKAVEPDLILLDLLLPHMGGIEFLHTYGIAKHPHVKVILLSNLNSPELIKKAQEMGIRHYLIKVDSTPKQMVEHVERALKEASQAPGPKA